MGGIAKVIGLEHLVSSLRVQVSLVRGFGYRMAFLCTYLVKACDFWGSQRDLVYNIGPGGHFCVQARLVHPPKSPKRTARARLRRECHFQQDREVVGDATGEAGPGVGAEGFVAGVGRVADQ